MYYLRKNASDWYIHNRMTRKSRLLSQDEVTKVLQEFPSLVHASLRSQNTTLFRNRINSLADLP